MVASANFFCQYIRTAFTPFACRIFLFARTEGFVVAPESAHAVRAAIDFANICKKKHEQKVIVFTNSGHGHFDLGAYDAYHHNIIPNNEYKKINNNKMTA